MLCEEPLPDVGSAVAFAGGIFCFRCALGGAVTGVGKRLVVDVMPALRLHIVQMLKG